MAYRIASLTLAASWTVGGSVSGDAADIDFQPAAGSAAADFSCALGPLSASGSAAINGLFTVDNNYGSFEGHLTAGSDTDTLTQTGITSKSLTGSVTISIPCYLCFEYQGASGNNPFAAGVVDAPAFRKIRFFLVGAGAASISATFAGMSASDTKDVRGVFIAPVVSAGAHGEANSTINLPGTGAYRVRYGNAALSVSLDDCTFTTGSETTTATQSGTRTFATKPGTLVLGLTALGTASEGSASITCSNGGMASASMGGEAQHSFDLQGVIRAMQGPYPNALTLSCARYLGDPAPTFSASDSFSRSYTQRSFNTNASAQAGDENMVGVADAHSKNEFADVGVGIVGSSLLANGDEAKLTRILMRGKKVSGLSISQAETHLFDDFGAGWSGTGGASISHDSAGLHITTAGTPGGATGTYSTARSMASYRYLRIPLKSVGAANVPITITIDGKSWSLTTGADGETVQREIDLCAPGTGGLSAGQSDTWDTRWPTPTVSSPTSGPFHLSAVSFGGIPASRQIVVGSLQLVRHDAPTVDCVPTLFASVYHPATQTQEAYIEPEWPVLRGDERQVSESGTNSQDFVRRFLLANTDGRQAIEESDFWYTKTVGVPSGVVSYSFHMESIQSLADQINKTDSGVVRWPGWSASVSVPNPGDFVSSWTDLPAGSMGEPAPADPYYFNAAQLLATEVHGGGILFVDGEAQYGWDLPTGSFDAQPLFDVAELCGLETDPFGHDPSGTGFRVALRAGAIHRAGAHGLVFDSSKQPKAGQAVLLKQSSATVASGTSRADGYWHADNAPAAKVPLSAIAQAGTKTATLSALWTRHRHRVVFLVAGQAFYGPLAVDGPRQYLHVADGKRIATYHLANAALAFESAEHAVEEWTRLCYDERMGAALFALGRTGDNQFALFRSRDQGRSLSEILSVNAKTIATVTDSERRWIICIYSDDADAVFSKVSKNGGLTWGAAQSANLSGDVLGLCQDARAGLLVLTLRDAATGVAKVFKTRDGEGLNWTLALIVDSD